MVIFGNPVNVNTTQWFIGVFAPSCADRTLEHEEINYNKFNNRNKHIDVVAEYKCYNKNPASGLDTKTMNA